MATSDLFTLFSIGFVQLLAVISPGPSFLITARTAVARSRGEGIKVAFGLGAGTVVWSTAALLGLNVLFHAVPVLFIAMRVAGALFLLYVASMIFRHAAEPLKVEGDGAPAGNSFLKGFLVQISNPKVAVFLGSVLLAMLPDRVPGWMTAALIGIFTLNEIWWYSAVSLFFSSGPVRRFYLKAKVWIDRVTGLFLGSLGLRLLWSVKDAL